MDDENILSGGASAPSRHNTGLHADAKEIAGGTDCQSSKVFQNSAMSLKASVPHVSITFSLLETPKSELVGFKSKQNNSGFLAQSVLEKYQKLLVLSSDC